MKIAVGSDHAGYEEPAPYYKPELVKYLKSLGHEVIDCGAFGPESVDYPDFAVKVCQSILQGKAEAGLLLCGTGIGIGIAANRFRGIRAAVCGTVEMARIARDHNDANVLCLGRRIMTLDQCRQCVDAFLGTPFSNGERHRRRVEKLDRPVGC